MQTTHQFTPYQNTFHPSPTLEKAGENAGENADCPLHGGGAFDEDPDMFNKPEFLDTINSTVNRFCTGINPVDREDIRQDAALHCIKRALKTGTTAYTAGNAIDAVQRAKVKTYKNTYPKDAKDTLVSVQRLRQAYREDRRELREQSEELTARLPMLAEPFFTVARMMRAGAEDADIARAVGVQRTKFYELKAATLAILRRLCGGGGA